MAMPVRGSKEDDKSLDLTNAHPKMELATAIEDKLMVSTSAAKVVSARVWLQITVSEHLQMRSKGDVLCWGQP
jgi:hypothetical protein